METFCQICVETHLAPMTDTKGLFYMAKAAYKTFLLGADLLHRLDSLKKPLTIEQKGLLFQGILEFENGIEPDFGGDIQVETAFEYLVRYDLEENNKKYNAVVESKRNNGKKGGRPRKDENLKNLEKQNNPNNPENPQKLENPKNLDIDTVFGSDSNKNITAGAAAANLKGKFTAWKPKSSPALQQWQADATRLAEQFKLDLDATYTKQNGKSYPISGSWYSLFKQGGPEVVGRLESAYSFFADQNGFFDKPDDLKWGYLRDIAHHGLEAFMQKGVRT